MGYMINFIVYTAAMIGIIFLAVFVYKKFSFTTGSKSKFLNVEDCISVGPRKEIFVVRAGIERFLVASDVGRTSLISKLEGNSSYIPEVQNLAESQGNEKTILRSKTQQTNSSIDDLPEIVTFPKRELKRQPKKVFKNIINNI